MLMNEQTSLPTPVQDVPEKKQKPKRQRRRHLPGW